MTEILSAALSVIGAVLAAIIADSGRPCAHRRGKPPAARMLVHIPSAVLSTRPQALHPMSQPNPSPSPSVRRFVLGISGASGAAYSLRLLELLLLGGHEVHLVVSDYGRRLLADESGIRRLEFDQLAPRIAATVPDAVARATIERRLFIHPNKDVGAVIASGSFLHDGMAILPCSSATLGAVATGSGSNLLVRAAMVTLKERRPLVVCHREMPLSHIDIENYARLSLAGAIVCPTNPGFYLNPSGLADIIDFVVGKVLDLLRVPHDLTTRWEHAVARGGEVTEGT
jgi:flavin prenyltransferase